ncbi:MAG: AraC-type DNA-binding protein/PAS domain-containing protein [Verrucomicrobia bacterium]|nr:MAG: AraC-type DNA-binding protein/PAS domain-containing protein [Verrucomicrobiota bacterium]
MPRPAPTACTLELRARFLQQIGPDTPFYQLFEHLPDIAFFAKDSECRIVGASRLFYERLGFHEEAQILGKDDFELFPRRLAETFRRDDQAVLQTGQPKLNLVELFFNRQGVPDWFVTNKLPVRDSAGAIIGLMGTTHSYEARKALLRPFLNLERAVDYIRDHFRDRISVEDLARQVHLSERQLHRKFIEAFGVGPQAFILKLRIQAACEALQDPNELIADVGARLGFCDQSAFTQAFHKHIGLTPRQFQMQFRLRRN